MQNKRKIVLLAVIFIMILVVVGGFYVLKNRGKSGSNTAVASSETQVFSKRVPVGKSFEFPVRKAKDDKEDKKITLNITEVERTNQILFKGQTMTTKKEKVFIVVHMELNNKYQEKNQVTTKDLIRLIDGSGKSFAPDVHNSIVDIEPISTKLDRVGFLVDAKLKKFKLQIGEISGNKEVIQINF